MTGKMKAATFGIGMFATIAMSGMAGSANGYTCNLRTPTGNNTLVIEEDSYNSSIKQFSKEGREDWSQTFPGSKVKFQPVFSSNGKYAALVTVNKSCSELRVISLNIGREEWVERFPASTINQAPKFIYTPNGDTVTVISNGTTGTSVNSYSVETGIKK